MVDGRVITRGERGVDCVNVMLVEEVDVFHAKRDRLGVGGASGGVFTRAEHEEEGDDAHILNSPPLGFGEGAWAVHAVEFCKDDGIDGPDAGGRRIFSGKGTEHFLDAGGESFRGDCRGAFGRVHHPDDFLADGTEVFSHCARSSSLVGAVDVASADADEENLEVCFGPLDPSEIAVDTQGVTEMLPMGPLVGLVLPCGFNHRGDAV